MDSTGYIILSLFSHKILVSDFPTQNSSFVFLMKTISFILPYFDCGPRGIFLSPIFGFTREELKMDSLPLKGLK